jgi:hypothetical protein
MIRGFVRTRIGGQRGCARSVRNGCSRQIDHMGRKLAVSDRVPLPS